MNWRDPAFLLFQGGSISPSQTCDGNFRVNQLTRSLIRESLRETHKKMIFFSSTSTQQLSWRRLTSPLFAWHDLRCRGGVRNSDIYMFVQLFQYSTRVAEDHCLKIIVDWGIRHPYFLLRHLFYHRWRYIPSNPKTCVLLCDFSLITRNSFSIFVHTQICFSRWSAMIRT